MVGRLFFVAFYYYYSTAFLGGIAQNPKTALIGQGMAALILSGAEMERGSKLQKRCGLARQRWHPRSHFCSCSCISPTSSLLGTKALPMFRLG